MLKQLNLPLETQFSLSDEKNDVDMASTPWMILPAGHKIGTPTPLFRELVSFHCSISILLLSSSFVIMFASLILSSLNICREMMKWSCTETNLLELKQRGMLGQKLR